MSATVTIRSMLRLSLFTLLACLLVALAASGSSDLEPLFAIPRTGNPGGCDDTQIDNLQKSYREARQMIHTARTSIETLQKPRPDEDKSAEGWDRKSRMLAALFGIKVDPKSGPVGEDKHLLDAVHESFVYLEADTINGGEQTFFLYCGAEYLKYIGPDDLDPLAASDPDLPEDLKTLKLSDTQPQLRQGIWWTKQLPLKTWIYADAHTPDDVKKDPNLQFCKTEKDHQGNDVVVGAFTFHICKILTWCRNGGLKAPIVRLEDTKIEAGKALGDYYGMPNIWVHELVHLVRGYDDFPAPDGTGTGGKVYGFEACVALSKENPDGATSTPDTYALFAQAMFLDQWDWSDGGIARPALDKQET